MGLICIAIVPELDSISLHARLAKSLCTKSVIHVQRSRAHHRYRFWVWVLSRSTVPPRVECFTENSVRSSDVAYFVWALKPDRECHAIISGLAFWSDYYVLCWFWCAKVYTCYAVGNFMLHTGVGFITTIKCEIKTCNINDTASRNSGATSIRLSDLYWITKLSHGDDSGKSYSNYTPWGELSDELRVA